MSNKTKSQSRGNTDARNYMSTKSKRSPIERRLCKDPEGFTSCLVRATAKMETAKRKERKAKRSFDRVLLKERSPSATFHAPVIAAVVAGKVS